MGSNFSFRRQKRYSNVELPCELVEEILCILPVKSLIRFKTVCKSWNLLINSHDFIDKHLHRKNPQLGGYPVVTEKERTIFPFDIASMVDFCNGIICLEAASYEKSLILFNPSTREFSFLPPECDGNFFGFCYLPQTQEYQIVSFHEKPGFRNFDIKTLTLGKIPSWRYAKNIPAPGSFYKDRHATSGTTMYWLGLDHDYYTEMVVCYDVIEARFSEMNIPPISFEPTYHHNKNLGVLKGSVIMFVSPIDGFTFFDIWMLIDDISNGKSWMKYRTVGRLETLVYPLVVCWYDRWILCTKVSNNLFFYDLESNQIKDYDDFQSDQVEDYKVTDPPIEEFANYVESLVSISSLVPCIDTVGPKDCR